MAEEPKASPKEAAPKAGILQGNLWKPSVCLKWKITLDLWLDITLEDLPARRTGGILIHFVLGDDQGIFRCKV